MAHEDDVATRAQALALAEEGVSVTRVVQLSGMSRSSIYRLQKTARVRGYGPTISRQILNQLVQDAPRSGRPKEITALQEEALIEQVQRDRFGREMTAAQLGFDVGVSAMSAWRILRSYEMRKRKATRKPGLTEEMKEARLQFALRHKYWTLEDWKNVIWTDETSIVLGHRRGGTRVWRTVQQRYAKTCVRARWKKASDFMFWGAFSYDQKRPMHIWKAEIAKEKREAQAELDAINEAKEPEARAARELEQEMQRLNLGRKPRGRAPKWKFTAARGAVLRGGHKGGVDWWRYQQVILKRQLIPFALLQQMGATA